MAFARLFRMMPALLVMSIVLAILSGQGTCVAQQAPEGKPASTAATKSTAGSDVLEVRFAEGGTMKVHVRNERIELETKYGVLFIPVSEIQRIEFGLRLSDETRKTIESAIANLGDANFQKRQSASAELLALREMAYPALIKASKGKDQEAVRRAEQLLEKLRDSVPEEDLELPVEDIVHTATSKIAGQIKLTALKIGTRPFGEQEVKLADLRSLRAPEAESATPTGAAVMPDPGTLHLFGNQIGKTLSFRVTGAPAGTMGAFGTGVYTTDSMLAVAAVHAGAIQPGKTGVVRVTMLGVQPNFQPSQRNGMTSGAWGQWTGYRVEVDKGGGGNKKD